MCKASARWKIAALMLGAASILAAGCGSAGGGGGGGGGGGSNTPAATLDCSATGHLLSGCWYGNQIRIDTGVSSLSIAIAVDGSGNLTGLQEASPDNSQTVTGITGATVDCSTFTTPYTACIIFGPAELIGSSIYVIPDNLEAPTHMGFVQAMYEEGWLEVGMFQKTKPAQWPPQQGTDYDAALLAYSYSGPGGTLGGESQEDLTGDSPITDEIFLQSSAGDLSVNTGVWDGGGLTPGSILSASTPGSFNASRGIFSGTFSVVEQPPYNGYVVPSADGQGIALLGCSTSALECLNSGPDMPNQSNFFTDFRLTWQWLTVE